MKKFYVVLFALIVSTVLVGDARVAMAMAPGGPENEQAQVHGDTEQANESAEINQKRYVETDLNGDGIKNSRQDFDGAADDEATDDEADDTSEDGVVVGDDCAQRDPECAQTQTQEREMVEVQEREQLRTHENDPASTLAEIRRLLEEIRNALRNIYGWS